MKTSSNHENNIITKKSMSKMVLQFFVWLLVIAFVSTIGVMWDDQGGSIPTILTSSKGKVDISPRDIFMLEYDQLEERLVEEKDKVDPRIFTRYLQNSALTNAANSFVRKTFYSDIKIYPSIKTFQYYNENTGLSSNMIAFQYADNYAFSPLGIFSILSSPTVSEMYAVNDLQNLSIASELLVLNKTNFLMSKISDLDKNNFYKSNFIEWIDSIVVKDFKVKNRGQARKVIALLQKNDLSNALNILKTDTSFKDVTYNKDKSLTAESNTYSYFMDVLQIYKKHDVSKHLIISEPIYVNGEYHVAIVEPIKSFDKLSPSIQSQIIVDYVIKNYDQLSKLNSKEWNSTINQLKTAVSKKESFSKVTQDIIGAVNHITQPFTLLNRSVSTVLGDTLANIPLLQDKEVLSILLNTPINEVSGIVNFKNNKDIYIVARPLERQHKTNDTSIETIYNNKNLFQQIYQYKSTQLQTTYSYKGSKDRYSIRLYPDSLTNLNPIY